MSSSKASPLAQDPASKKEPQPPEGNENAEKLAHILRSHAFDGAMGIVIMLNMVMIIIESDFAASAIGTADEGTTLAWADGVGWFILIVFCIELAVRLYTFRLSFFRDGWNTFDCIIVFTDSIFSVLGLVLGSVFPVSTLRVFRLFKLARVSKVFRVFPELRIMMAGLVGSFRSIFWGSVLLTFAMLVWAIVAVQFIHPLNKELADSGVLDGCDRCGRAYESVMQATLTFCQQIVAGDSWGEATIPVIEAYPITAIYFLAVFLSVGFAVMNLILGVVVNVAQSEHDRLKIEIQEDAELEKMQGRDALLHICEQMDKDGSGSLTKEELLDGYEQQKDFRDAIAYLAEDFRKDDLSIAFSSMDADKSGTVSYIELVKKIYKMKDMEASFLLEQIKFNVMEVKDLVFSTATKVIEKEAEEELMLEKIEAEEHQLETNINSKEVLTLQIDSPGATKAGSLPKDTEPKRGVDETEGTSLRADSEKWEQSIEKAMQNIASAAGELQTNKETMDAILSASQVFQSELGETMRRLERSVTKQASDTSRLLDRLMPPQRPGDELLAATPPSSAYARGCVTLPFCMQKPAVNTQVLSFPAVPQEKSRTQERIPSARVQDTVGSNLRNDTGPMQN